ncbi:MAG: hypothetical protein LUE27_11335 [Clostridia bacterium]|nr:hypothetical protein [Clostridia bacterium]
MKKSSIFLVVIICLVSFFAISFLGQAVDNGQFKQYISDIVITNDTFSIAGGPDYIVVDFDDDEGYGSVIVQYDYEPEDATEPEEVSFSISDITYLDGVAEHDEDTITVSDYGEVTFLARASITLTILATDGGGAQASVMIICS